MNKQDLEKAVELATHLWNQLIKMNYYAREDIYSFLKELKYDLLIEEERELRKLTINSKYGIELIKSG